MVLRLPFPLVYVVEDDEALRTLVVEALEELGCTVSAFGDAEAMLKAGAGGHWPELLITDVRLPGLSGVDALALLRAQGLNLPVFVMTAFPSPQLLARMEGLEVGWVFQKPFDPEDLVSVLREFFQSASQGVQP
ncbi:MAG TPA: response regulator [Myxococcota bacterium]|nr:response regulator [Myxococcota bacterium]